MSITSKDSILVLIVLICFFSTIHCTRICYSCTNLQENEKCLQVVQCQNDEVCFTQKYQTSENVIRYDVGCTYPEICRKDLTGNLVGRRSDHSHMMCQKCCNGSHVCNDDLTCDNSLIVPKQNCLSCSEVKSPALCTNISVCHEHEACFLHKFKTEDNQENFDLGCKDKSLCLHASTSNGFGRRSSPGRHLVCENCCSGSDSCNRNLLCGHHMQEGPNSACTMNSECESNLVCLSGRCQCLSSDYFWNGFVCMTRKSINEECEESRQCKLSLQCRNKKCQCIESNYWTGSTCAKRKSLNGTCATLMECRDTLFCVHSICRCDYYIGETWDGYSCGTGHSFNGSCTTAADCRTTLSCAFGKCTCNSSESWNGHACVPSPRECEDLIISISGIYTIYPGGGNLAVQVYCVVEANKIWTVIQRRESGSVDFDRGWNEYKYGFGIASGDYWLGNENIHIMSTEAQHEISIYLEVSPSNYRYANYSTFRLGDESSKYSLAIGGYRGNAGDSMTYHNGLMFSTKDSDHDVDAGRNCAARYKGGWWYKNCYYANLNREDNNLINWRTYSNYIRKTTMMIRRK
ncbi:uncharacterized protein [Mytilus edulis]|uniref:uncharacterized protein n=1 Tax=Mytilus edulis TaxID=6550 RepID=UPI0039EEF3AC